VGKTVFFLCDMQEKFSPAIHFFQEIVGAASKLIETGKILNIPLIVTEQYPKGLGSTVSQLDISHAAGVFEKTKFSMVVPAVEDAMKSLCSDAIESAVLFGVETHVCIEQTAIDLIDKGITVHVVADATSSRSQEDRLLAFQRLSQIGCFVSTSESIIFKLVGDKNHPNFNQIRALVKNTSSNTGLSNLV